MSDLEELLRTDLRDAAATVPDDVDVDDLLHRGRRLRTARTRRHGLAAVAAAVVVGLASWAGLALRTTSGVPDPAATPSIASPGSFVTFTTGAGSVPRAPYSIITATESDGVLTLTGRDRESDPGVRLASVSLNPKVVTGTAISPRLSLWLIPGQVDWVEAQTSGPSSVGSYSARHGFLSASGVTVVVAVAQQNQRSADWVEGVIWRATDGTLHSSAGAPVSTAVLSLSDTSLTVYRDPGLKVVSFFDAMDGRGFASTRDDLPARELVKIRIARENAGHGGWEEFAVGILPPGAGDPKVTTTSEDAEVATGVLQPDGAVTFVVRNRSDAEPQGSLISKVTYTDADGSTRTYRG